MFSRGSSNSISFATVTPSLVIWGPPNDFPIITLRPLGPRVTFTASANALTPRFILSRASISNFISFAILKIFNFYISKKLEVFLIKL